MSLTPDGGLANVFSPAVNSWRATTPSKIPIRNITPQRSNSAPRSSSNNKELRASDVAYDSSVLQRAPSRSASRRKQRQWENKNLFGFDQFKRTVGEQQPDSQDDPVLELAPPFEVKWKSALSELLKPENQSMLTEFLNCKEAHLFDNHKRQKLDMQSCADWNVAEASWVNVERKVRLAVANAFHTSHHIRNFLKDLEHVLLYFLHFNAVLPSSYISDELRRELVQPISVDSGLSLRIALGDSAFKRMLLHGAVQFYGLHSKSVMVGKNKGKKVTVIMKTRSSASDEVSSLASEGVDDSCTPAQRGIAAEHGSLPATAERCISLCGFLAVLTSEEANAVLPAAPREDTQSLDDLAPEEYRLHMPHHHIAHSRTDKRNAINLSIRNIIRSYHNNLASANNISIDNIALNTAELSIHDGEYVIV